MPAGRAREDPVLRLAQSGRARAAVVPFPSEPHGFDPPVGIGHTLDHTIALQKVDAPREGRLIDGERLLELSQVGFASASDGARMLN